MDDYGYGSAALMGLRLFEMSGRASGKTTRMMERITDDDLIVFANAEELRRVEFLLRREKKSPRMIACDPADPGDLHCRIRERGPVAGRILYDAAYVLARFERAIMRCERELDDAAKIHARGPANESPCLAPIHAARFGFYPEKW